MFIDFPSEQYDFISIMAQTALGMFQNIFRSDFNFETTLQKPILDLKIDFWISKYENMDI